MKKVTKNWTLDAKITLLAIMAFSIGGNSASASTLEVMQLATVRSQLWYEGISNISGQQENSSSESISSDLKQSDSKAAPEELIKAVLYFQAKSN